MTRIGRPPKPFDYYIERTESCWLWRGVRNPEGYGMFVRTVRGMRRYTMAHRWAWIQVNGAIPVDYTIDHLCRVTSCVNPDHLEAVPHQVNVLRGNGQGAINARKTHCPKGHPLTRDPWKKNGRRCVICRRAYDAAYQRRRRAEKKVGVDALRNAA